VPLVAAAIDDNVEVERLDAGANPYLLVGAVLAVGPAGIDRWLGLSPELTVSEGDFGKDAVCPVW
jgi:glutamine synthetase